MFVVSAETDVFPERRRNRGRVVSALCFMAAGVRDDGAGSGSAQAQQEANQSIRARDVFGGSVIERRTLHEYAVRRSTVQSWRRRRR